MASLIENLNPDFILQPRNPVHEMSEEFTDREFPNLKSLLSGRGPPPIADIPAGYVGKVPGTDGNRMLGAAMELLPWVGPGFLGRGTALAAARAAEAMTARAAANVMPMLSGNGLASRYEKLYNLANKTPRPFTDDYKFGGLGNAGERLSVDIEGRPLIAQHVAGRTTQGGADQAISPTQFNASAEGIAGGQLKAVAPGHPKLQGSGGTRFLGFYDRPNAVAYVDRDLPADQLAMVAGHELGHHIDTVARYMPLTRAARKELENVYSTLATGQEWRSGGARTLPKDYGYSKGFASDRELVVEGMRAYMDNPNSFKTMAPEAAKLIREHFNNNPKINRTLQFNTIGGGLSALPFLNQPPSEQ